MTASLLTQQTTAFGQDKRENPVMTEIWMDAGGVVLTTITDVTGFFVFLGLATWAYA